MSQTSSPKKHAETESEELLVVDQRVLEAVEAFAEEKVKNKFLHFYKSPQLRQFWGDEQEELESWKELFFDLIFVAVAFSLGHTLDELMVNDESFLSAIYFYAQFSPLFATWLMRMLYLSRFVPTSYFHGLLDLLYALLIALMAVFIASRAEIEASIGQSSSGNPHVDPDENHNLTSFINMFSETAHGFVSYNTALGFAISTFLGAGINAFRCWEMMYVVTKYGIRDDLNEDLKTRQKSAVLMQGKVSLCRVCVFASCMLLSIIGAVTGDEALFLIPLFAGFFVTLLFHIFLSLFWQTCFSSDFEIIPINVGFVIKRLGEFTMLMLGEGVLQIIVTDVDSDNLEGHFETFILAFLVLACLYVLIFYGLPFEPEEHAFRKSRIGGMLVTLINPLMFSSIIGVGVGLKLVLRNEAKLDEIHDATKEGTTIFLTITVFLIIILRMLSHGYYAIFKKDASRRGRYNSSWDNVNWERIAFTVTWLAEPFLFLTLQRAEMKGPSFLGVVIAILSLNFVFAIIEQKVFMKPRYNEITKRFATSLESYEKHTKVIVSTDFEECNNVNKQDHKVKLLNILHYMRNKTRRIANDLNRSIETRSPPNFPWQDVEELERLTNLVKGSCKDIEYMYMNNELVEEEVGATL